MGSRKPRAGGGDRGDESRVCPPASVRSRSRDSGQKIPGAV